MTLTFKREMYLSAVTHSNLYFTALVIRTFVFSQEQAPFYLQFIGEDSIVEFSEKHVSFGHAVNICSKICKDNWWCGALRKCADSRRSFRCHVTCRIQKSPINIPKHGEEKCHLQQVSFYF
jgi:hypothetical protein